MTHEELLQKAKELGIENAENLSYKELQQAVKRARVVAKANELGLEFAPDEETSVIEELIKTAVAEAKAKAKADENAEKDLSYKYSDGRVFVWSENTPDKFRFNNVIKTKEEWMQDDEAMEQMILGNLHYLILKTD